MDQDPFLSFLSTITNKIKVEKEYKTLIEDINKSESSDLNKDPFSDVLGVLQKKIEENKDKLTTVHDHIKSEEILINNDLEKNNILLIEKEPVQKDNNNIINEITEGDIFGSFLYKLKAIVKNQDTNVSETNVQVEEKFEEDNNKEENLIFSKDPVSSENITSDYIKELEKVSDEVASEKEPEKLDEIKKLISEYAEIYFKKAAIMSSGGGGTMSYNYYNGGTIYGDLNITGDILSGGTNLTQIFSGGGGGGGDPAVNTLVYSNSANWDSSYTNLTTYSAAYLSSVDITLLQTTSSNWDSSYTNLISNSATYLGTTRQYDYVLEGVNSYSYCGYTTIGIALSSPGWTINRLYFSTAGTLISSGAVTNAIWNNRYSYSY